MQAMETVKSELKGGTLDRFKQTEQWLNNAI